MSKNNTIATRPLKIGIVCYPSFGGSGIIATELGKTLSKRGHNVHFVCYNRPARLPIEHAGITFHLVDIPNYPLFDFPPYTLALTSKLADVIDEFELDIIHVHYAIPHSTAAHLAQEMVKNKSLKIITTLHGTDIQLVGLNPSYFRITKHSIENNNGITAVSEYLAKSTKSKFKIKNDIAVIPNFVDLERFSRKDSPEFRLNFAKPDEKIICHTSNFRNIKRIPDVIKIFYRVQKRVNSRLVMIGAGPELDDARELVNKLRITDRVTFLQMTGTVEDILGVCDLFLLPSELESFGLAALEAMSCGVPVIASHVGGIPEFIENEENGFLAPMGDIETMSEMAVRVLSDVNLYNKLSSAARETVVKRFSENAIVNMYEDYYRKILSTSSGKG